VLLRIPANPSKFGKEGAAFVGYTQQVSDIPVEFAINAEAPGTVTASFTPSKASALLDWA
jgi:hypothetical protein